MPTEDLDDKDLEDRSAVIEQMHPQSYSALLASREVMRRHAAARSAGGDHRDA